MSTEAITLALATLAWDEGIRSDYHAVVALDETKWHTATSLWDQRDCTRYRSRQPHPRWNQSGGSGRCLTRWSPTGPFKVDAFEEVLVTRSGAPRADRPTIEAPALFRWWRHEQRRKQY